MPKIDPAVCLQRTGTLYPEPYRAAVKGRRLRRIGLAAGLTDFGANVVTLGPGDWSSQFREGESFYRHRDGSPDRPYARDE